MGDTKQSIQEEEQAHMRRKGMLDTQLAGRRSDLAVYQTILGLVQCSSGTMFTQLAKRRQEGAICQTNGGLTLHFRDSRQQKLLNTIMTPDARRRIHELLAKLVPSLAGGVS